MNVELLLIDMMSELGAEFLQNDYIEKDIKKEKIPFMNWFFSCLNHSKQKDAVLFTSFTDEIPNSYYRDESEQTEAKEQNYPMNIIEAGKRFESSGIYERNKSTEEQDDCEDLLSNNIGLNISIFKSNFRRLFVIISSITTAFLVLTGIILIIVKRQKGGVKLYEKKVQVIY